MHPLDDSPQHATALRDFRQSVIYQIYPKSFQDSDGDGLGDLPGVSARLDYLQALGVDYLWLTPFFVSPQRDNGYDVADYRRVDPRFGTMADVEALIAGARARGMGVMLDMVFNHTSTEHEWFQRALAGEREYQERYIFRAGSPEQPPTNWQSKFGGSAWAWAPEVGQWYLHLFDVTQADLNWDNPAVRRELQDVVRFWLQKGVAGFRFDVVNLISKPDVLEDDPAGDGRRFYTDGPRVHEYLHELSRETGLAQAVTVGEMSSTSVEHCILYTQPQRGELNMVFNFHHLKVDYAGGDKWTLMPPDFLELKRILFGWQQAMSDAGGWMATFWGNHDQPRPASRFGSDDPRYRPAAAKMLATAGLLLRGTPYIFQGEELGLPNARFGSIHDYRDVESHNAYAIMRERGLTDAQALDVLAARSRDQARTPMRWTPEGGFSTAVPWLADPHAGASGLSVQEQLADPQSVLHHYRALIALHHQPLFAYGEIEPLLPEHEQLLAYRRVAGDEAALVLCNFSAAEVAVPLDLPDGAGLLLGNLPDAAPRVAEGQGTLTLRPYEAVVYRLS